MSRGEFLATGAAAAAGVSLGAAPLVGQPQKEIGRSAHLQDGCAGTCPPEDVTWEIPAATLNALWGDCIPRLVPKYWQGPPGAVTSFDDAANLANSEAPGIDPGQLANDINGLPTPPCSRWEARKKRVVDYLQSGGNLIPMRLVMGGGFDYVLSDWGLDLLIPYQPQELTELLRYYTFRRTGRPMIGLPFYRQDSIDVASPTGPSQSLIDPEIVIKMVQQASGRDDLCVEAVIRCIETAAKRRDPSVNPPAHLDLPERVLDTDSLACILEPLRCWQVTGAVYLGIQTELPRVVATVWIERHTGAPANGSYSNMITANGAEGLRKILEQRLESTIPHTGKMIIQFQNQDDLTITNRGLSFPAIKNLYDANTANSASGKNDSAGALTEMLTAMQDGRAGNPVFTDSQRTVD